MRFIPYVLMTNYLSNIREKRLKMVLIIKVEPGALVQLLKDGLFTYKSPLFNRVCLYCSGVSPVAFLKTVKNEDLLLKPQS